MSNQYGYVPLAKSGLLQQHYTIASPATWTFERWEGGESPALYGGVEEVKFTDAQKAELVALGGAWFDSAESFQAWLTQFNLEAF